MWDHSKVFYVFVISPYRLKTYVDNADMYGILDVVSNLLMVWDTVLKFYHHSLILRPPHDTEMSPPIFLDWWSWRQSAKIVPIVFPIVERVGPS